MSEHLSAAILNALADGELSTAQLAAANDHLAGCSSCTSQALYQSLLKSSTARAGQRYVAPSQVHERLVALAKLEKDRVRGEAGSPIGAQSAAMRSAGRIATLGWAAAAVLLLVCAGAMLMQRRDYQSEMASAEHVALIGEVFDEHVATMAGGLQPQVVSTDRHTVKPWFQGKIPFSFNLPENLPKDTTLDGANLSYLGDQPVAQLLYSIGKHRVSVFVRERAPTGTAKDFAADHAGFHVLDFSTDELEMVAVSDVDPARLGELTTAIRRAQADPSNQGH